ncbi:MAG: endonuclease MutS2 [Tannerella sp.]|jgi:DNA mismatch repair protein MutS2|nr:endonuclease MutS2 [Tannerella sp.]
MQDTYPHNFEEKIGFDKIKQLVNDKCLSELGREKVSSIAFSADISMIRELLSQTDEFLHILQDENSFPSDYFIDTRYSLRRIRPEGTWLDEKELFDLKRSLQTIYDIIRFFRRTEECEERKYPSLTALAGDIPVFPQLVSKIDGIIDKYGRVKDSASSELQRIRREITSMVGSVSRNLQSVLRAAQAEGLVDKDVSPTMRDGRLVIPVAPAFKRRIKGIVHDESATGKTVFIEPESVVEANNRIRELENEEKRETVRILTAFTDFIRPTVPDILLSYSFLAEIDFIRAKALFAKDVNATKPAVENKPLISWHNAVHPLLMLSLRKQSKSVVSLDVELHDSKRILIISGPNAGGKSVCLKTVGLLQYMLQCGLLIPVGEHSQTGVFQQIFIDIGDEQSLENDLSTYSSHLTNMKFFERNCNARSLILIDEFGSGTEPVIGGALAESLLDRFNRKGSFGVITTHYSNLKLYAEDHDGVQNGAMLYDRHLMQPLFKLSTGRPGSSFAIEIARKIGLPDDVIAEASAKVGSDYIDMDKYLQDIVRDKRYWESKRQQIRVQEKKLEDLIVQYEHDLANVNSQRKEIVRSAKAEAQQILSEANAKIENTIREIKEAQADKERTRSARQELDLFKTTLVETHEDDALIARKIQKLHAHKAKKTRTAVENATAKPAALSIGDAVRIKGQDAVGTLIEIKDNQAIVAFGMLKSTIKTDKLERVSRSQLKKTTRKDTFISAQTTEAMHEKRLNFKQEIDVRGMRGDEALQTVTYYIDDAMLAGVSKVRILHGTGNGILRRIIREYLATTGVRSFHDEHVQFGGAGITVVEV